MRDYELSTKQIAELERVHRSLRDKRQADRVKAVIALSNGWPAAQIAEILLFTENPFDKSNFTYDPDRDCYVCPRGEVLQFSHVSHKKQAKVYRGGSVCKGCPDFGQCTKSTRGRGISRLHKADLQEKFEAQYAQSEAQRMYALRKQKVELPFGHIKRNLKVDSFLLRGLDGVKAETSIMASCFNMARMISILGVAGLIAKLGG